MQQYDAAPAIEHRGAPIFSGWSSTASSDRRNRFGSDRMRRSRASRWPDCIRPPAVPVFSRFPWHHNLPASSGNLGVEVRPRASRPLFLPSARIQDHEGRSATQRDLGNLFLSAVWLLWTCGKTHSVLQEQHVLPVLVAQRTNTVLIRHNRGMGPAFMPLARLWM